MRICILLILFVTFPTLAIAHDVTSADQNILTNGGLLSYIWVGAKHMLTGYDHLLFLIGVIFYLNGLKDILKFITVFTIGHSVTLTFGTIAGVNINEYVIDAIIAISVFYKGFENLGGFEKLLKTKSPNPLMMVFIFGLIHGLGLSSKFQSFDIGMENIFLKIVSFNIGVELGQISALVPIVILISRCKKFKNYSAFYKASNVYLMIAGVLLFLWQLYIGLK